MVQCPILSQASFPLVGWMNHRGCPLLTAHYLGSRRLNHVQNTLLHPHLSWYCPRALELVHHMSRHQGRYWFQRSRAPWRTELHSQTFWQPQPELHNPKHLIWWKSPSLYENIRLNLLPGLVTAADSILQVFILGFLDLCTRTIFSSLLYVFIISAVNFPTLATEQCHDISFQI